MKKMVALLVVAVLLCSTALAVSAWTCPGCGRTGNTDNFCGSCGTACPNSSWTCPNCGKSGLTGQFCTSCGYNKSSGGYSNNYSSSSYSAGDHVSMGSYRGSTLNWIVLTVQNGKALLITEDVIEAKEFSTNGSNYWGNSTLRTWLNNSFYSTAFNSSERSMITTGTVSDPVFVLSVSEANSYLLGYTIAYPRSYLLGSVGRGNNGASWYWLRDSGSDNSRACIVRSTGEISTNGDLINWWTGGVRPAIWIYA